MPTCVNCPNEAEYHVADPGVNPLDLCDSCLPNHWRDRARAGHFTLLQSTDAAVAEVVEESVINDDTTPAPRRRR